MNCDFLENMFKKENQDLYSRMYKIIAHLNLENIEE